MDETVIKRSPLKNRVNKDFGLFQRGKALNENVTERTKSSMEKKIKIMKTPYCESQTNGEKSLRIKKRVIDCDDSFEGRMKAA